MSDKTKFLQYCRMTCLGGSEQGRCLCLCPVECEMYQHPEFER